MQTEQKNIEQFAIELHTFLTSHLKKNRTKKTQLYFSYSHLKKELFINIKECKLMTNHNNDFYYMYCYCKNYHIYAFYSEFFNINDLKNF
jgi:hypothetical protein